MSFIMAKKNHPQDKCSAVGTSVVIIGKNQLHNDLLQSYIESQNGYACACKSRLNNEIIDRMNGEGITILIIDSNYTDIRLLNNGDGLSEAIRQQRCHPVLFNVEADQKIEKKAIGCGVRGIFYSNEPIEHLIKGLRAVLAGELWFPRMVISEYILSVYKRSLENSSSLPQVTQRERQILIELSGGASNQEIADRLNISQHTVKTHIYNCYKKIGVSNRLQATVWASRHL
jgi:LuxR family transcriptional regulator, positive regulator of biofilm formation